MKHCTLEKILDENQSRFVKDLFKLVNRPIPQSEYILETNGKGEGNRQGKYQSCSHRYNFGFQNYCDDKCLIQEYLIENKDKYPELYKKVINK